MSKSVLNWVLVLGVYGFSFLYIAWRHYKNIEAGGHRYLQGDWLVNFADGPVRRGLSGELFLALGDVFNVSPVVALGVVQLAMLAIFTGSLLHIAFSKGLTDGLTLFLLSPALVVFWVNDPFTPFRKELLGYLVFIPLFLWRTGPVSTVRLALSALLLAIAVAFHEANAVFLVPLILVYILLVDRKRTMIWIAISSAIALAGTVFSLIYVSVPNVDGMCQRLVESGASPGICEGSISWLSKELVEVVEGGWDLVALFAGAQNLLLAGLLFVCLFGLAVFLLRDTLTTSRSVVFLGIGFIAFVPLYAMGGDWGRWVSAQMFVSLFIVFALAEDQSQPRIGLSVPLLVYLPILGFNMLVGMYHMVPSPQAGLLQTFIRAVSNALS